MFHIKEGTGASGIRRRYACLRCATDRSGPADETPWCCGYPMVGKETEESDDEIELDIMRFLVGREPKVEWEVLPGDLAPRKTTNVQMDDGRWWSGTMQVWMLRGLGRQKGELLAHLRILEDIGVWQFQMAPGYPESKRNGFGLNSEEAFRKMLDIAAG